MQGRAPSLKRVFKGRPSHGYKRGEHSPFKQFPEGTQTSNLPPPSLLLPSSFPPPPLSGWWSTWGGGPEALHQDPDEHPGPLHRGNRWRWKWVSQHISIQRKKASRRENYQKILTQVIRMSTNKGGGFTNKQMHQTFFLTFHSLPFPIWIIQRVDASLFGLNWTSYIWVHFELPLSDHLFWNLEKGQVKYERQQWQLILKGTPQLKI